MTTPLANQDSAAVPGKWEMQMDEDVPPTLLTTENGSSRRKRVGLVALVAGLAIVGTVLAAVSTGTFAHHHQVVSKPSKPSVVVACESNQLSISCPSGTKIIIGSARYGRRDTTTCSASWARTDSTTCSAAGALDIVTRACNGKGACVVGSNNDVFGDPCVGIYKYLEVSYQCSDFTAVACESQTLNLNCPTGSAIAVSSANYGRTDSTVCYVAGYSVGLTTCTSPSSTSIVGAACNGKQSCSVGANNGVFGDPCYGTYKYLTTSYSCQAVQSATACESSSLTITCPAGQNIVPLSANYGRTSTTVCYVAAYSTSMTTCSSSNSLSVVKAACEGKNSCVVGANNSVFGDPCFGTYKYLSVSYMCA